MCYIIIPWLGVLSYVERTFTFGDYSFQLTLSEAGATDYDLTGQVLWPAARSLCTYLFNNKAMFKNKTVLELGSGVGMSGLLVSKMNGNDCVLTDGNKTVVELLQKNVNRLNSEQPRGEGEGTLRCVKLKWGTKYVERFLAEYPQYAKGFDYIIGSDIVYFPDVLVELIQTVSLLLSHEPGSAFILCYQERAKNVEQRFYNLLEESDTLQVSSSHVEGFAHTVIITRKKC
jgi:predicted nicotinamide N-methyase